MTRLFGTSGIRGVYGKEVTLELAMNLGLALGTYLGSGSKVLIARDPRTSSLALENSLISGLLSSGCRALRAGMVPTPTLAYSVRELEAKAGVMITASHNPPEYNGIKLWDQDSAAFEPEKEERIEEFLKRKKFDRAGYDKLQNPENVEIAEKYMEKVLDSVKLNKKHKIALDCGNGACSLISPSILEVHSKELKTLHAEPDGTFPNRMPEPSEENLKGLISLVKKTKADVGFAHDGDGDRLAVVDEKGRFVGKDALLALLAKCELDKEKGNVVVPIDTSKLVEDVIEKAGGFVVISKVGDVSVAQNLKEKNGIFGGEPSGCFIFPKIHLCPDGILSALKVLEFIEKHGKVSEFVDKLPRYHTIRKVIESKNKYGLVGKIAEKLVSIKGAQDISEIDGTRVDFENGWALVRASGTEPKVRITVEGKDEKWVKALLGELTKTI